MATEKKQCPMCGEKIAAAATTCPKCKTKLEVTRWQVTLREGETFETEDAAEISKGLLEKRFTLEMQARRVVSECKSKDEEGKPRYLPKEKGEVTGTLREVGRKDMSVRKLYEPLPVYTLMGGAVLGGLAFLVGAVAWMADLLLMEGGGLAGSIVWSFLLLVTLPTVIGLAVVGIIVHAVYGIAYLAIGFRLIVSLGVGLLVGAGGFAVGFGIGAVVGLIVGKKIE